MSRHVVFRRITSDVTCRLDRQGDVYRPRLTTRYRCFSWAYTVYGEQLLSLRAYTSIYLIISVKQGMILLMCVCPFGGDPRVQDFFHGIFPGYSSTSSFRIADRLRRLLCSTCYHSHASL